MLSWTSGFLSVCLRWVCSTVGLPPLTTPGLCTFPYSRQSVCFSMLMKMHFLLLSLFSWSVFKWRHWHNYYNLHWWVMINELALFFTLVFILAVASGQQWITFWYCNLWFICHQLLTVVVYSSLNSLVVSFTFILLVPFLDHLCEKDLVSVCVCLPARLM